MARGPLGRSYRAAAKAAPSSRPRAAAGGSRRSRASFWLQQLRTRFRATASRFPGYRAALNSFLITQMFPAAILLVPIYDIIVHHRLLNTKTALVLAYSTTAVPFCVWMLKGYFDTIPISLEEAGRIDGLTPFGTFWRIVMPLSLPGLAVTCFYAFITAWNEVAFANIILVENDTYTLPVGLRTYVFQFSQDWDKLTAGAVLVSIPAILVFLVAQRYLVSGLTRGGVKG